jgi:hypothetical protein
MWSQPCRRRKSSWERVSTPSATIFEPQAVPEVDDRAHNDGVVGVVKHVAHERPVDLQLVDGKPAEMRERGVAGAEIVERDRHAARMQSVERLLDQARIAAEEDTLGDLDLQMSGGQPRCGQGLRHREVQIAASELGVGHVDRDTANGHARVGPGPRLSHYPFEHQSANWHDQSRLLGHLQELPWQNQAALRMLPAKARGRRSADKAR